jgi:uncharacterized membrane protein YbhN (UPF0104 family)
MRLPNQISLRRVVAAALPLVVLAVVATTPQLLGRKLGDAWSGLAAASPLWLWVSVAAFLASVLATVLSWRAALAAAGARLGRVDAAARYGVGCLVNTFAPASLGEVVRIGLLAKKVGGPERVWTTSGAAAAVAAVRGVTLAGLIVAASLTGALPLWPVAALLGASAVGAICAWLVWRRHPLGRVGPFLGASTALLRCPRAAAAVFGWSIVSQVARLLAAAAVATALGVSHPLLAALVIMPTLQIATIFPLTPGNVGVASGAVALALQTRGVELPQAIAAGIAYHAAETLVGVAFGVAGTLAVVELPPYARRLAAAGACVALAAGLGATVLSVV